MKKQNMFSHLTSDSIWPIKVANHQIPQIVVLTFLDQEMNTKDHSDIQNYQIFHHQ
jgi:hypothetical protein